MKICMLTSGHSVMDNRVFFKEARSLQKYGHDVSLIVPMDKDNYFLGPLNEPMKELYPQTSFIKEGIAVYGYSKTRRESATQDPDEIRLNVLRDFASYIENDEIGDLEVDLIQQGMERDADVYHAHEISSAYAAIKVKQFMKKKGKDIKVVYDVHEFFPSIYSHVVASSDRYRERYDLIIRELENLFLSHSDLVITVSESIRQYLLGLKIDANVHLIKNVPILKEWSSLKEASTKRHPLVCYEGHIRFERGLKEIVEATEYLSGKYPEFKLLMVGEAVGHEEAYLNSAIEEKGLGNNLIVTGWQSPDQAATVLSEADIGIVFLVNVPYCKFALPNKLFNYMRAGLAIIGLDYPDMGGIIKETNSGIALPSMATHHLVNAIEAFIQDSAYLEQTQRSSRRAYEDVYNWGKEEKKLIELYRDLQNREEETMEQW